MTEGVRWFIPCSGSVLLNLGWNPALQPATRLLIFKPKASVGGGKKKKNVVSVDSFLISHNYPLLLARTEPFHVVFVWVFVVVFLFFFSSVLLARRVAARTLAALKLKRVQQKTLWRDARKCKGGSSILRRASRNPGIDADLSSSECSAARKMFAANVLPAKQVRLVALCLSVSHAVRPRQSRVVICHWCQRRIMTPFAWH